MKTMMIAVVTTLGALVCALQAGCATAPEDEPQQSSSDELAAVRVPALPPPIMPMQCASVSIAPCVGNRLGGACPLFDGRGGMGTCGDRVGRPRWIPGVATPGWDCNVCVPDPVIAAAAAATDSMAAPSSVQPVP